jgi:hypothetical protein
MEIGTFGDKYMYLRIFFLNCGLMLRGYCVKHNNLNHDFLGVSILHCTFNAKDCFT